VHALGSPAHAALLPGLVGALVVAARREAVAAHADAVHGHWLYPGGLAAVVAARAARCRSVVTLHGSDVELAGRNRAANWLGRRVAARADAVVAVSAALARRAEDVLHRPAGSIGVARLPLPYGLRPTPFPVGAPRLIAAGRASPEKGFDVLVAALARPETAAWSATFVTEGPERDALERAVARAGLTDRVSFMPMQARDALFDLMRAHHLVVVPSRTEGLGLVALEALALGRPVVASAVGGLVETITDGDDGALVRPDDPAALAAAIAGARLDVPVAGAVAAHQAPVVLAAHASVYGLVPSARP
jgi:glycosyltransferase involved in cell wall biosynthesis